MKKQKGITLISLVVTVILLIILAGVTGTITTNILDTMNKQKINAQLEIIEASVDTIYEEHKEQIDALESVGYVHYTVQELEALGISGIEQEAWINWQTRKVKMQYNGQDYESQGYKVEYDETQITANLEFTITYEWNNNRYNVEITPQNNIEGLRVAYRKKNAENWILVDKYEFEFVESGTYEFRLTNKAGNSNIKEMIFTHE